MGDTVVQLSWPIPSAVIAISDHSETQQHRTKNETDDENLDGAHVTRSTRQHRIAEDSVTDCVPLGECPRIAAVSAKRRRGSFDDAIKRRGLPDAWVRACQRS
jgi:hypothetical protein